MNVPLSEQNRLPVEEMWDGFDRFCKVQELNGRLAGDLKDYQMSSDLRMNEMAELIAKRVTDEYLTLMMKRAKNDCHQFTNEQLNDLDVK